MNQLKTTMDTSRSQGFADAVDGFRRALEQYVTGNPQPVMEFVSQREDVTLANPLGPPLRGPAEVGKAARWGSAQLRDGSIRGFEEISRYCTSELGYVVQIERSQARFPGSETMNPIALRVTMIFRPEGEFWKLVHRHADPITAPRPITSTIQS